jgi:putative mRNA 3-end processing factor
MRVRARARQGGVSLPLVISDHADWEGLTATIAATGCSEVWVTHGQEDALVHWAHMQGLRARPLDIVGYGDEEESENPAPNEIDDAAVPHPPRSGGEGLGVGGDLASQKKEPPTPDPSPPLASLAEGGEQK